MIRTLVVDDEKIIRDGLVKTIPWIQLGYELVGEAPNAAEALALSRIALPDLVISDIRMPGMSGLELIEKIHAILPNTHFIILSGYDEFTYAQKAITLGVEEYMLKPIYRPDLIAVLEKFAVKMNRTKDIVVGGNERLMGGIIKRALDYIAVNYREATLAVTADIAGVTPQYLSTRLHEETGRTFREHLRYARMDRAKFLLLQTSLKNHEIASHVGLKDPDNFTRMFKRHTGVMPGDFRERGADDKVSV